jgi:undecaprenyl-diphosphatase
MLKKFDKKIFFALYNYTLSHQRLSKLAVLITKYSSKIFSTIYISTVIYLIYNSDPRVKTFILIPAAVYLMTKLIPYLYNRRRPFAEFSLKSLIKQREDHSFPSTHTASSLIISLVLLNISLELGFILIFLAVLTALSRIMVGVHYPTDIIGAWLLALATHFLALIFLI